jgi:hypothetical protein
VKVITITIDENAKRSKSQQGTMGHQAAKPYIKRNKAKVKHETK